MFTHKRNINESYFDNLHSKKTRTHVQKMINDEKKIEDAKNKDRNIYFYWIKQFKKLNVYLQALNDDHEFLLTAHVNNKWNQWYFLQFFLQSNINEFIELQKKIQWIMWEHVLTLQVSIKIFWILSAHFDTNVKSFQWEKLSDINDVQTKEQYQIDDLLLSEKLKTMMNKKMINDLNVIREALTMKILQQFQNSWKDVTHHLIV